MFFHELGCMILGTSVERIKKYEKKEVFQIGKIWSCREISNPAHLKGYLECLYLVRDI
jgi:hypothetical protein